MFGLVFYIAGCLLAAFMLTGLWVTFKPIQHRDDMRSMRVGVILFLVIAIAPYTYTEILTNRHGKELEPTIKLGFEESEIDGELIYYKVVSFGENKARAIAVGLETEDWGGTDRPIVAFTLEKVEDEWEATSYYIVYSVRLDRDNATFPPYR